MVILRTTFQGTGKRPDKLNTGNHGAITVIGTWLKIQESVGYAVEGTIGGN